MHCKHFLRVRECFWSRNSRREEEKGRPKATVRVAISRALSIYEKNPKISVVAKVEFPIGKKLFHLVVNPGT